MSIATSHDFTDRKQACEQTKCYLLTGTEQGLCLERRVQLRGRGEEHRLETVSFI